MAAVAHADTHVHEHDEAHEHHEPQSFIKKYIFSMS